MRILDQFLADGDWLFRWRSYLPIVMVPVLLLGLVVTPSPFSARSSERLWEGLSILVALTGLALRAWAVGTAPSGTSERSTVTPRASELRTSGLYSVVRHPLYVGNGLMGLGLALFPAVWYLPVILALATFVYYERIAAREEAFLEERFGDAFRRWAAGVPALLPGSGIYVPPSTPFSWRKVMRHEYHGLMVIAAMALVLDVVQESVRAGRLTADPVWLLTGMLCAVFFVVMAALKKTTRVLKIQDADPSPRQSH
jgi:protein-S-isoprenylcysteine O-methyltransferase Ste14